MDLRSPRLGAVPFVLLAVVACQRHDLEPVEPFAVAQHSRVVAVAGRRNAPNLMLLVDKSASMNLPVTPGHPDCTDACRSGQALCPPGCPTRWTELQSAVDPFLPRVGAFARLGLTTFPADALCGAPSSPRVELARSDEPQALQDKAEEVRFTLAGIQMAAATSPQAGGEDFTGGGTPTGGALAMLAGLDALHDDERQSVLVLLTDGLPNCNAENPNSGDHPQACVCQASQCSGGLSRLGCLDAERTVAQVAALRARGVTTVVVGLGLDTASPAARATLEGLARAGGFPRLCPNGTDAECGAGNACDAQTNTCRDTFFSARDAQGLAQALEDVLLHVGLTGLCSFKLDAIPSHDALVSVLVDGVPTAQGPQSWRYEAGRVTLQGELCERVTRAPASAPVSVEFRVLQTL